MRARALYDFVADSANGELSFREGDIIDVTNTVRVCCGRVRAHEQEPHHDTTVKRVRRRRTLTACADVCGRTPIACVCGGGHAGDQEGGDGWWEGKLGSETGIFPENYVEVNSRRSLASLAHRLRRP